MNDLHECDHGTVLLSIDDLYETDRFLLYLDGFVINEIEINKRTQCHKRFELESQYRDCLFL